MVWVLLIGGVVYLARMGNHKSNSGGSHPSASQLSDAFSGSGQQSNAIDQPKAGVGEHATRLLAPVATPAGSGGYLFAHLNGKVPVTYDPCRAIHYVIRDQETPDGGDALIREAIAAASKATGLQFIDDGASDETPNVQRESYQPARYGDRWAPVLIAWTGPTEVKQLNADVEGYGGSNWVWADGGSKNLTFVTGGVFLNTASLANQIVVRGLRSAVFPVVEHELGHVLGLAHVSDPAQIMNPESGAVVSYGPGDRRGLAQLGQGACHPEL
jgi:hypothetical protein